MIIKKIFPIGLILILTIAIAGCGGGHKSGGGGYTGVVFTVNEVPAINSFPTGMDDGGTYSTVGRAYYIAQTEVTYELWKAVHDWATSDARGSAKYSFANPGVMGGDESGYGNSAGGAQQPVTSISWRDAMVWCNALTEYYAAKGGTGYDCVYYTDAAYTNPIRTSTSDAIDTTSGTQDNPYVKAAATGFRLPTGMEWELAARYIKDANSDNDICDAGEYYPGDFASGADADYNDTATADFDEDTDIQGTGDVAVYTANSGNVTASVKSKSPNALGLYDISGNVWEWCFDWETEGSDRVMRGGSYYFSAQDQRIGFDNYFDPSNKGAHLGFRVARTK